SHAIARRLPAEVLYDAIHRATGSLSRLPGLPAGARAAQMLDSSADVPGGFFVQFGKPARESACECERSSTMMLGSVLNLVNGPVVGNAISDPTNRLSKLVATEKDDGKVIEELYLAFLGRLPTKAELQAGLLTLKNGEGDYPALVAEAKQHQNALAAREKALDAQQAQWEAGLKNTVPPTWTPLEIVSAISKGGATLTKQTDGSILASGKNPSPETYTVKVHTKLNGITGIRLKCCPIRVCRSRGQAVRPTATLSSTSSRSRLTRSARRSRRKRSFCKMRRRRSRRRRSRRPPPSTASRRPAGRFRRSSAKPTPPPSS